MTAHEDGGGRAQHRFYPRSVAIATACRLLPTERRTITALILPWIEAKPADFVLRPRA
jgi:hypothetical protein